MVADGSRARQPERLPQCYEPPRAMFFTLSKILGWFINPLHLGLVLIGVALVLRRLKKRPRVQKWLVIVAIAEMWIFSLRIVSEPLLWGLEHQYPRAPELAA